MLLAAPAPAVGKAPPAKIRVGGPSAPGDPKVAIIVGREDPVGKRFQVIKNGERVMSGKVKPAKGSPSPWKHAGRIVWSGVDETGAFRIKVGKLTSPPWRVSAGATGTAIERLLSIFAVNADGDEPNPVFGPSHLNDANAPIVGGPTDGQTIDVEGGWRDAGDAIKFTVTTAMASTLLDYAAGLEPAIAPALSEASNIGVRWLVKAHPAGSQTFIAQVSGSSDHDGGFRNFANDDASPNAAFSKRKAYGDAGSGTLGAAASALASASLRAGALSPAGLQLRALAEQWYARGKAVTGPGPKLEGFEQPGGDPFSDWEGFMALAAVTLWRATGNTAYLADAKTYLAAAPVEGGFSIYFAVGGLAAADMCGGMGREPVPDVSLRELACDKLIEANRAARFRAGTNAFRSPGGFYFGWVADHTGSAFLDAAAQRAGVMGGGLARAFEAREYLFGRNPWGASFVVGGARREAHHPHHSVTIMGDPSLLGDGFVVGGPAHEGSFTDFGLSPDRNGPYFPFNPTYFPASYDNPIIYEDRTPDFITSEVGLGYSAPAIVLLAQLGAPLD